MSLSYAHTKLSGCGGKKARKQVVSCNYLHCATLSQATLRSVNEIGGVYGGRCKSLHFLLLGAFCSILRLVWVLFRASIVSGKSLRTIRTIPAPPAAATGDFPRQCSMQGRREQPDCRHAQLCRRSNLTNLEGTGCPVGSNFAFVG